MRILSIETSADDTGIAILDFQEKDGVTTCTILGAQVSSQIDIHTQYGGIFPMLAKREHIKNIPIVYEQVVKQAGNPKVDAIAVTVGPGLEPCLWVGIKFAEELAERLVIPIIPVNHMEGHLLSSLLPEYEIGKEVTLNTISENTIALLVSGGHTEIIKVGKVGEYTKIGHTIDDAVGEAYDKVARMLGLPYPGGPEISRLAEISRTVEKEQRINFPRPMLHAKNYNFSFSGLKTAVLYYIRDNPIKNEDDKIAIARAFEDASIEVLIKKITNAVEEHGSTDLLLGGGVSANKYLQSQLQKVANDNNLTIYTPRKELTGDNAVMIGLAGYFNSKKSDLPECIAQGNLTL
jgi:N6-L-threonylcarbamoyladenine synthase